MASLHPFIYIYIYLLTEHDDWPDSWNDYLYYTDEFDDSDSSNSDDFPSPGAVMANEEVNETQNTYPPGITPQRQRKNTEPSSPMTVQSSFRPSNQYLDE